MTPKEKSIDLYNKYFRAITFADEVKEEEKVIAKRCALIAVDEIIESFSQFKGMYDQEYFDSEVKYCQEVKQEIESL